MKEAKVATVPRKQWLEDQIWELVGKENNGELTADDKIWLDSYKQEYQQILDKEAQEKAEKAKEKHLERKRINRRWKRAEDKWRKYLEPKGWEQKGHMRRGIECADWECGLALLDHKSTNVKHGRLKAELRKTKLRNPSKLAWLCLATNGEEFLDQLMVCSVRDFLDYFV